MAMTVRADVVDGVQPPDVTNAIWPKLKPIRDRLDPAYRIEIGGAIEESQKGNASIFVLFPVMTTPPPTPQSAAMQPARDPTASDFKMIVGVITCLMV